MNTNKFDLVTVVGVTVCVLSFFLILYFNPGAPPPAPPPLVTSENALPPERLSNPDPASESASSSTLPESPLAPAPAVFAYDPLRPAPSSSHQRIILSHNDELTAYLDPVYGGIDQLVLEQHFVRKTRNGEDNGGAVTLGQPEYPFLRLLTEAGGWLLEPGWAEKQDDNSILLQQKSSDGSLQVEQRWWVEPENTYELKYEIKMRNLADQPLVVQNLRIEGGTLSPLLAEPGKKASRGESSGGVAYGQLSTNGRILPKNLNIKELSKKMTSEKIAACAN